jgi:DNA-binding LacI/PurR family transcriptional regulator
MKKIILFFRTNQNQSLSFFISLMTSIVAGVIVAIFIQNNLEVFWQKFGLFLMASLCIMAIYGYIISLKTHNTIVVLTYIDPSVPFISAFISALVSKLQIDAKTIEVVYDSTKGRISNLPEQIAQKMNIFSEYIGVILIPNYKEPIQDELIKRYSDSAVPLIILDDINRGGNQINFNDKVSSVGFIYHSNKEGALLAVEKALDLERKAKQNHKEVIFLVIGFDLPSLRHKEYISQLKKRKRNNIVEIEINTGMANDTRFAVSELCKKNKVDTKIKNHRTIVFCSSDDLTIGFLYYLKEMHINSNLIDLISYDGTIPIKTLLKIQHLPIKYAIEQDVEILSEECISLLKNIRDKTTDNIKKLDLKVIQ